ncbi:hypothetical protein DPEC_G00064050 [Dallia pectoralis]|uniref:Uncharacterized protein n=1 Tax=Dallia pectoralis TaxID=75939 RepID=A0ACC2H8L4_DALPE|nr:hypothetical protein DPEC_G00064050 [Dallia pectoralis]
MIGSRTTVHTGVEENLGWTPPGSNKLLSSLPSVILRQRFRYFLVQQRHREFSIPDDSNLIPSLLYR